MASPSPKPSTPQPTGSYTAVPGRLVPIPNTEFLLLLPDEEVPVVPPQPRGRPRGKAVEPCTCPHCVAGVVGNGQERHLCHFPDCGKTFTKTAHLQVGWVFLVVQFSSNIFVDSSPEPRWHPPFPLLRPTLRRKLCQEERSSAAHWKLAQCRQFPLRSLWKEFWEERSHEDTLCHLSWSLLNTVSNCF